MASITLQIPEDLQEKLRTDGHDAGGTVRLAAAFSLCQRGELSTSQAAALAGMTYGKFLEAAALANVELFSITPEELSEQVGRGFTMGSQRVADHSLEQGRAG